MTLATSGVEKKNGGTPEGARQGNQHMLNVAEKPEKAKLLRLENGKFVTQSPEKRAADWLDKEVARAKDGLTVQVITLTPSLATVLLNRNEKNRKVTEANVEALARDMANGKWALNGHTIVVTKDGQLNDGQHRCLAVIRSDCAIETVLTVGVERETRLTLDQGRARTISDYLSMDGYVNSTQVAAAAGYIWQYQTIGNLSYARKDRPTRGELMGFIEKHPNILTSVEFVMRKEADAVGGKSILAFCHWMFSQTAGRDTADYFIERLMTGSGLAAGNPILYVRNRIVNERGKMRPAGKVELIFKGWNAYRRNRDVSAMRIFSVSTGRLPKLEA